MLTWLAVPHLMAFCSLFKPQMKQWLKAIAYPKTVLLALTKRPLIALTRDRLYFLRAGCLYWVDLINPHLPVIYQNWPGKITALVTDESNLYFIGSKGKLYQVGHQAWTCPPRCLSTDVPLGLEAGQGKIHAHREFETESFSSTCSQAKSLAYNLRACAWYQNESLLVDVDGGVWLRHQNERYTALSLEGDLEALTCLYNGDHLAILYTDATVRVYRSQGLTRLGVWSVI